MDSKLIILKSNADEEFNNDISKILDESELSYDLREIENLNVDLVNRIIENLDNSDGRSGNSIIEENKELKELNRHLESKNSSLYDDNDILLNENEDLKYDLDKIKKSNAKLKRENKRLSKSLNKYESSTLHKISNKLNIKKHIPSKRKREVEIWRNKLRVYNKIVNIVPTSDKIVLFQSSVGRNYTGNPRYIYEEMVEKGYDKKYKCVWVFEKAVFDKGDIDMPGNAMKVRKNTFKFLFYSLRSKLWIFDTRQPNYLKKSKNTKFIQTWHGTPLKKLALDMEKVDMSGNTDINEYRNKFKRNSALWDYLVSQNSYSSEIFRRAFAFNGEMLEIGYPRNDILFRKNNEKDIDEIKTRMNIPKDKKVILYAPTWRDNEFYKNGIYKFATQMDFDAMKESLDDDYVLIVKYHYSVKDNIDWDQYSGFVIECNESWDIQELYLVSDILITDYSSVMFDYAILKRPMLFFTYDLKFYKNNLRDFYFDMVEEVPGPLVETTEELISEIMHLEDNEYYEEYGEKYDKFNDKYNEFDSGTACERIIDILENNK